MGRPSTFTPEMYEAVCEAIETTPKGLKWILDEKEEFPKLSTFYLWQEKQEDREALMERYRRARNRQAELLIDETMEISDDTSNDTKIVGGDENEREVANTEWIQRSKVRIETRFKLAGKLDSSRWGDKIEQTLQGPDGKALELNLKVDWVSPEKDEK